MTTELPPLPAAMEDYPEPGQATYTAAHMRAYARTALEAQAARIAELEAALDGIKEICEEEWHVRGNDSRITEIRGYARAALAKQP